MQQETRITESGRIIINPSLEAMQRIIDDQEKRIRILERDRADMWKIISELKGLG